MQIYANGMQKQHNETPKCVPNEVLQCWLKRQLAVWTLRKMEYQFLLLYRAH